MNKSTYHNLMTKRKYNDKKSNIFVFICLILSISLMTSITLPLMAFAAATAPTLLTPTDNATAVNTTNITFSWVKFGQSTAYSLELSLNENFMGTLVLEKSITNNETSFIYTDVALKESTKYYWHVIAMAPEISAWSNTFNFTTRGPLPPPTTTPPTTSPPPTTTPPTTTTVPPGTTLPATTTPSKTSSDNNSFLNYINDVGWPFVIGMVFILIVIIVLVFVLLSKPKRPAFAGGPGYQAQNIRGGQTGVACGTCGFMNTADRKFCAGCGSSLYVEPPQQYRQSPGMSPGMSQGANCPTCGFANPSDKQFCGNCGMKLMPPVQQQTWQTQQSAQNIYCPSCGAPAQQGQQFCGGCGASVANYGQQQVIGSYQDFMCPICGTTIQKGVNPCPGCKTWLDWAA